MKLYMYPYNLGSESAKLLAKNLGILRIDGTKLLPVGAKIINWGNSVAPKSVATILNPTRSVNIAKNKLTTFNVLKSKGISIPDFTTNKDVALSWVDEGHIVYARESITGHKGIGIKILEYNTDYPSEAMLYTKRIHAHEYRVHVFNNKVIDFTKKRRRSGVDTNKYIKNYDNGWVFCRDNISLPDAIGNECIKAVQAIGLTFGAVDVLFRERENKAYILEINTAPGIEGTTLDKYTNAIKEYCR